MTLPKTLAAATLFVLISATQGAAAESNWYASAYLGYDDFSDLAVESGPILGEISFDRDVSFGVAGGWRVTDPLRLELELMARKADADQLSALSLEQLSGGVDVQTLMLNAVYEFPFEGGSVTPFVGVGAGWSSVEIDNIGRQFLAFSGDDDVLAYQGILGVSFPVNDAMKFSIDARYLRTDDVDFSIGPGQLLESDAAVKALSVMAGLRYEF